MALAFLTDTLLDDPDASVLLVELGSFAHGEGATQRLGHLARRMIAPSSSQ